MARVVTLTLPRVGEDFAGYGLRGVLGRGGMSVVYEAENRRLGSAVALKVLAPELATDDTFRARFLKESRIAASLNHPNVIPIYDVGPAEDLLYIAMRYVSGADLRAILKAQGRITPAQALLLIGQAARALDAAHRRGLVHRDVKPANFLVERGADDDPDHVYLADFGISKHTLSRSGLTATGQFVGTIDYIAPEQIQDKPVDGRTDIYSLGCVLYECLTGNVPFQKDAEAAVIWAHVEELPTPPSAICPELPSAIDQVIGRALAKDPAERYGTCHDFIAEAREALHGGERSEGLASHKDPGFGPPTVLKREPPSPPVPLAEAPHTDADLAPRPPAAPPLRVSGTGAGPPDVQQPAQPPTSGAPPTVLGDEPGERGEPMGPRSRRPGALRGRRAWLALLAALVAVGAVVGVLVATGGSGKNSHPAPVRSPLLQALARTNQSTTAKGLLPPSSCRAQSASMVTCRQPAFAIERVTFQTFPSLTALYTAYVSEVRSLNGGQFATNFGECAPDKTNGEVSWNHNYEHHRSYSLAQLQSGSVSDEQAAGRLFCVFSNSAYHVVWTMNDGRLLAALVGAPHDDAYNWWHGVHHSIALGAMQTSGNEMSGGHM
ncbi:MAG: hypothetical protein E6G34_11660 [Actinobacteria bacterium]|nr:MAG: hypothetical protein E6G34_11660 [Actinomycetota bacterium]